MNLKEAFQMQKALNRLMEEAASYLDDTDNIMTVTEKHLRSKVVPEQADEECDCSEKSRMAYNPMTVLRAWHALMEEKERLGRAITAAKTAIPLNFDTAAEENKARRRFLQTLAHMAEQRSESRRKRGAGKGYVFNKDGNQTPYCYDIEVVKTIDYDRNAVRRMQDTLAKKAADTSRGLDDALVRTEVDFALQLPIPESTLNEDPAGRRLVDTIFGRQGSALAEIIEALEGK
jgi:hypothetical protein